jgi:iron complex outermembrane receptor protein
MMNILKKTKLAMAITTGIYGAVISQGVLAQEEAKESAALEVIIVTAQKRSESLQETPIAISAFSSTMLDERGITDVESLVSAVPGMHFSQAGSNTRITLRGIGTEQTTVTGDPGVAFHVDGVYQARASASSALFYDLERVEVLRGPQGTLYGRNATGGSINLISKRPESEAGGEFELQIGNYDHKRVRGVFNVPLIEDKLLFRISGQQEKRDGFYENLTQGVDDLEDRDSLNLRTQLLYTPTDTFDALLSVNYSSDKGAGEANKGLGDYPISTNFSKFINIYYAGATPNPSDTREIRTNANAYRNNSGKGASLTLDWDLGSTTLQSISAWQELVVDTFSDADFSDVDIINENRFQDSSQYSQELRLSSAGEGPWEWVTGLYWLSEESNVSYWLNDQGAGLSSLKHPRFGVNIFPTIDVGLDNPAYFGNKSTIESDSVGAFVQTSYSITEDVKLTAGLRYSEDEKSTDVSRKEFAGQLEDFSNQDSWSKLTWKLGTDWQVTRDNMVYASVSTGFKSGGFLQQKDAESYDEEEILAWEFGSKNRFFEDRLQANITAYSYEYTDMQLRTIRELTSVVTNAGESEIKGIELELLARPIENLELSAALAYTDAKFVTYFDDDPLDDIPKTSPLDLSGNDLARSPDSSVNLLAAYTWELSSGRLRSSINYHWSDDVYFSSYNRDDLDFQESYHKTDASLTYYSADDLWYITLSAQNLGDVEVASQINPGDPSLGGINRVEWQTPRMYKLSVGYHFW